MNVAQVEFTDSGHFSDWLAEQRISLAVTTYQSGKLFLMGVGPHGRLSVFERTFNRCMGLWADGQTIWISSLYQLWRLENVLESGQTAHGHDRLYVPQLAFTTGSIDVHDVAVDAHDRVVFVNTLFSCLATVSETHSFAPLWKPTFISELAAEDRCHLNGLALEHGRPRFVTSVSQSDVADGWRDDRTRGGCVIDVSDGRLVATGLSMPHSPRVYRDRLWLLNSGSGYLGRLNGQGQFEEVAFCPGYLRGLAFLGDFAVIGMSRQRAKRTFSGLALDDNLQHRRTESRCGLCVIDLRTGDVVHWLRIEGLVSELYDVAVLPSVARPMALGLKTDEIQRTISIAEPGHL